MNALGMAELQVAEGASGPDQATALWRADSRRLINGLISLAIFFALVVALMLAVPGLRSATRRIEGAELEWITAAVACELLSCASYAVLFGRVFARLRPRVALRLSLSELAMNSVVSAGGLGGFALGAWFLRSGGAPMHRIAERSAVLYMLTSAVSVAAVALLGLLMGVGALPGSSDPLLTLLPAGVALASAAAALGLAAWAKARLPDAASRRGRLQLLLGAVGEGIEDALRRIRRPDVGVLAAVGYWLFDNLVLLASFYAYGVEPALGVVAMGYLLGMLGNSLPIPGGFGAVEGALMGMLLLYGLRPASLVLAAVITYRVIALWIPSVVGTIAFLGVRAELGQPLLRPSSEG